MGRIGMVDLLTKVSCFVRKKLKFATSKAADVNYLVQGEGGNQPGRHPLKSVSVEPPGGGNGNP
jgi:hypothetical protein